MSAKGNEVSEQAVQADRGGLGQIAWAAGEPCCRSPGRPEPFSCRWRRVRCYRRFRLADFAPTKRSPASPKRVVSRVGWSQSARRRPLRVLSPQHTAESVPHSHSMSRADPRKNAVKSWTRSHSTGRTSNRMRRGFHPVQRDARSAIEGWAFRSWVRGPAAESASAAERDRAACRARRVRRSSP